MVGSGVGVSVGGGVGVSVAVCVGVSVGAFVGVAVAVGKRVAVFVGVGVQVAVGDGVLVGVLVGDGVLVGVGVGVADGGRGMGVKNWPGVAGKGVAVFREKGVDVGMGVAVPGGTMVSAAFVGVADSMSGRVVGDVIASSSGTNMKAIPAKI